MSESDIEFNTNSFLLSLYLNLAIGFILIILFILLRKNVSRVFNNRLTMDDKLAPVIPNTYFSWFIDFWRTHKGQIYNFCGIDTFISLDIMRFGMMYCLLCIPIIILIMPVNYYGSGVAEGLNKVSTSNLTEDDEFWFFAHTIAMYYMTLVVILLLTTSNRRFYEIRIKHMKDYPEKYKTLFVTGINTLDNNNTEFKKLFTFMYQFVAETFIVRDWSKERKIYTKRDSFLRSLENEMVEYNKTGKIKTIKKRGLEINKIDYYIEKLDKYNNKLNDEISKTKKNNKCGFVTFDDVKTFLFALQAQSDLGTYTTHITSIKDIYWPNTNIKPFSKLFRQVVVGILTLALIFLWSIPVILLQSVITVENLEKWVPGIIDWLESNEFLYNLFTGFLPTIVLVIFMALLPSICWLLSIMTGIVSLSELKLTQIQMLFWFNYINVFLVSTFSGAVISSISDIIDNPTSIVNILATTLPSLAIFFTNYILVLTAIGMLLEITKIKAIIVSKIKLFFAKTPREIREANKIEPIKLEKFYPECLLCFVLCMTYGIINPIIYPFGFAFFSVSYFIIKYENLYISLSDYDMCGRLWPICYYYILVALLTGQITLFGIILLNKSFIVAGCLVPVFLITIFFIIFENKYYIKAFKYNTVISSCELFHDPENNEKYLPCWMTEKDIKPET